MLKLVGVGNNELDLAERHPRRAEVMVSEISNQIIVLLDHFTLGRRGEIVSPATLVFGVKMYDP